LPREVLLEIVDVGTSNRASGAATPGCSTPPR
jgi:hypothetical protein